MSRSYGSAFSGPDSYSSDYIYNLKMKTAMCYLKCNPNHYVTLEYAEHTYIKITTAELIYQPLSEMYEYVTVVDASNIYLKIFDASDNYLKILDASANYLSIVDASNTYLSRKDIATSEATSTSFTGTILVQGFNLNNCYNYNASNANSVFLGNRLSVSDVGGQTVVIGNYASVINGSVGIGSSNNNSSEITSARVTFGVIIGYNAKGTYPGYGSNYNVIIGSNSIDNSSRESILLGSTARVTHATSQDASGSYAIGYGTNAILPNQMIIGTSGETIYCPGNPSGGQTPNTCLVLSSNVTLNTLTNTPPISGQLGYQFPATITVFDNNLLYVQPFATFTSLGIGVWYITGSINLTQTSGISGDSVLLKYSLSTTLSTHNSTQYGFVLSYCTINNSFGFNYNNIIINNSSSQTYYLVIEKTVTGLGLSYTSNTSASYLIATRIA